MNGYVIIDLRKFGITGAGSFSLFGQLREMLITLLTMGKPILCIYANSNGFIKNTFATVSIAQNALEQDCYVLSAVDKADTNTVVMAKLSVPMYAGGATFEYETIETGSSPTPQPAEIEYFDLDFDPIDANTLKSTVTVAYTDLPSVIDPLPVKISFTDTNNSLDLEVEDYCTIFGMGTDQKAIVVYDNYIGSGTSIAKAVFYVLSKTTRMVDEAEVVDFVLTYCGTVDLTVPAQL